MKLLCILSWLGLENLVIQNSTSIYLAARKDSDGRHKCRKHRMGQIFWDDAENMLDSGKNTPRLKGSCRSLLCERPCEWHSAIFFHNLSCPYNNPRVQLNRSQGCMLVMRQEQCISCPPTQIYPLLLCRSNAARSEPSRQFLL